MAGTAQRGAGTTTAEERHRLPVKTLVSAGIGNAVEFAVILTLPETKGSELR